MNDKELHHYGSLLLSRSVGRAGDVEKEGLDVLSK
jgi:hypothetical protein